MNPFQKRRNKLLKSLDPYSITLFHSGKAPHKSYDEMYEFYPNMNFYYLTGIDEDNVILMMVKEESQTMVFMFVEETTPYMKQWIGEKITKQQASDVSGVPVKNIMWTKQFDDFFHNAMHFSRLPGFSFPNYLYVDLFAYKKDLPTHASQYFDRQLSNYPNVIMKDINEQLTPLRMIKDEYEVAQLKHAIHITNQGLKRIMKELSNRTYEYQLEADFLHQIRLEGATEIAFKTIAASGKNATVLHYENNHSTLNAGDFILFDLGAKHHYYSADISRTYPINGTFSLRQKEIYNLVLKANKKAIEAVKPGISWEDLNKIPKDILAQGAKELGIVLEHETIEQYYYHTIGHYLGLDTHDVGGYGETLQEGMVITIEPGLYVKKEQIGVRIEDNILVTKDGGINLSKDIIKEIDDIENYIQQHKQST